MLDTLTDVEEAVHGSDNAVLRGWECHHSLVRCVHSSAFRESLSRSLMRHFVLYDSLLFPLIDSVTKLVIRSCLRFQVRRGEHHVPAEGLPRVHLALRRRFTLLVSWCGRVACANSWWLMSTAVTVDVRGIIWLHPEQHSRCNRSKQRQSQVTTRHVVCMQCGVFFCAPV